MDLRAQATAQRPQALAGPVAPVLEVFASIQGEGLFVGEPQVFLRLAGCPLRCRWCDTPESWALPSAGTGPGTERRAARPARIGIPGAHRTADPWATALRAATWIAEVEEGPSRTVSITGGEPLLHAEFVAALRPLLGRRRLHLETAGAHPEALAGVLAAVDHVSLDLKLPADLDAPLHSAGEPELPHDAHSWALVRRRVLGLVRGRDACAKIVVAGGRSPHEFAPLLADVAELAPELPVVLQPVTPRRGVPPADEGVLQALVEMTLEGGLLCRVVPQIHPVLSLP